MEIGNMIGKTNLPRRQSMKFTTCNLRALLGAAIIATMAPAAQPAVRAVIPGCCDSFGSITKMQPSTGAIIGSLRTVPEGNYEVTGVGVVLTKGGGSAAVLSYTSTSTKATYVLTVVNLATGAVTGPLTISGDAQFISLNPISGVIYIGYVNSASHFRGGRSYQSHGD
jgi:hypothetical protein